MSVKEWKEVEAGLLDKVDDEATLRHVIELLNQDREQSEILRFTPQQRARVERGLEDVRQGRVYSDSEFEQRMDSWLNEMDEKYGKGQVDG